MTELLYMLAVCFFKDAVYFINPLSQCEGSTQPDEKKAKKLKDKATRPVFVLTFDEGFKVLTGTLNGEAVSLEVKSKAENDDDLGF